MHILITGGAGYIGSYVASQLLLDNSIKKVTIYDNLQSGNYSLFQQKLSSKEKLAFVQADILDSRKLKQSLKGVDIVIHAAGINDFDGTKDAHLLEQINHWGTSEVCNAIEQSDVKSVIYLSDCQVYSTMDEHISEENEPNPETPYAFSKFRGEGHLYRLPTKTKHIVLRTGIVFGNQFSSKYEGMVNKMMFDAHFKGRISILGNGRHMISITSLAYLSYLIQKLIANNASSGSYLAVEQSLQVLDLVEVVKEIYPELEFIFINPHLQLKGSNFKLPGKIKSIIDLESLNLTKELSTFKNNFSF
ncbi:MAG: SDR family oxidoreductase [Bacteroidota bacterium]|nr:SDR family oxidoreductase [Bacteroidota bacterium]